MREVVQNPLLGDMEPIKTKFKQKRDYDSMTKVGDVLLLGGGVQSGCLLEMALAGDIPRPDLVVFADTGNDPIWVTSRVRDWANACNRAGISFAWARFKAADELEQSAHEWSWSTELMDAGMLRWMIDNASGSNLPLWLKRPDGSSAGFLGRRCTSDWKTRPGDDAIRKWLLVNGHATVPNGSWGSDSMDYLRRSHGDHYFPDDIEIWHNDDKKPSIRVNEDVYVDLWFGITTDESGRARSDRDKSWGRAVYPFMEMVWSRQDCIDWLVDNNIEVPDKSACVFCPFRSTESWVWFTKHSPYYFEQVCELDDWIRSDEAKAHPKFGQIKFEMYIWQELRPLREVYDIVEQRERGVDNTIQTAMIFDSCKIDDGWNCFG
jgi:hypothetical protein